MLMFMLMEGKASASGIKNSKRIEQQAM